MTTSKVVLAMLLALILAMLGIGAYFYATGQW